MGNSKDGQKRASRRLANANSSPKTKNSTKNYEDKDVDNTQDSTNPCENSVFLCEKCNIVVGEEGVSCGGCGGRYHYTCVGIPSDQSELVHNPQIYWFCHQCNPSVQTLLDQLFELSKQQETLKEDLTQLIEKTKSEALSETKTLINTEISQMKKEIEDNVYKNVLTKVKEENAKNVEEVKKSYAEAAMPPEKLASLKKQLQDDVLTYTKSLPTSNEEIFKIVDEQAAERERIKERAANLILHNLPETRNLDADIAQTTEIIKNVLKIADFEITKGNRLGFYDESKNRLFKITLKDVPTKKKILSRATMLRDVDENDQFANVYIRPDMTPKQVEASKNLQTQLREVRNQNLQSGKKFKIYRGKIIEVTQEDQSNNRE